MPGSLTLENIYLPKQTSYSHNGTWKIFLTIPMTVFILFIAGMILVLTHYKKRDARQKKMDIHFFLIFFFPFLFYIIHGKSLSYGLNSLIYLSIAFVYFTTVALHYLHSYLKKNSSLVLVQYSVFALVLFILIGNIYFIYRLHPEEFEFFNILTSIF